jgi:hypothetical protein
MFTLNPLPAQISPDLVKKLVRAEPATIGHFRDWGFMDPGIKAMQSDVRIAGLRSPFTNRGSTDDRRLRTRTDPAR